jgi:hypothetical protein
MSTFGARSRGAHPSTPYGDVEAATQDAYRDSSGSSTGEDAQLHSTHGGNGVSGGHHEGLHGGNGTQHPGNSGGGLAEWGRRHGDSLQADSRTGSGGDEGQGLLDWQADEPGGEQGQPAGRRPWWRGASSGVALICLLLTLASFVVPESEEGIGMVMKHVRSTSANAKVRVCMHTAVHQVRPRAAHREHSPDSN